MKRKVELHAAADRDLDRLVAFLVPMSERAARTGSKKIREKLASAARPEAARSNSRGPE